MEARNATTASPRLSTRAAVLYIMPPSFSAPALVKYTPMAGDCSSGPRKAVGRKWLLNTRRT